MEKFRINNIKNICSNNQCKKYIWFDVNDIIKIRKMMEYFIKENIYIDGFATELPECADVYLFNKKIVFINDIDREKSLIISYKENNFTELKNIILDGDEIIDTNVLISENECFAIQNVGWMREIVKNKKLFIYGFSARSRELARIYELLDFRIEGYISDELNEYQEDRRVITVEELIYEEDFFLLLNREQYLHNSNRLSDLGIVMFENLAIDNPFGTWFLGIGNQMLDINLGHSFLGSQGMCGFEILGNNHDDDYKIAVLGGSTTDGTLFPFKSWPEFLLKKMENSKVTIFNGGVVGYTSTQEFMKLLRDILYLTPDMVIVYDGFNDIAFKEGRNPFDFSDIHRAMEFVHENKSKIWLDIFAENAAPYTGICPSEDKFSIWLNNIKRMKGICESEGIKFIAFHQPILYSKPNLTKNEKGLLWSTWRINDCYKWANIFREKVKAVISACDYIYDLSNIFDNETDVYMEDCHVYEKGNNIIADAVYRVIRDKIQL